MERGHPWSNRAKIEWKISDLQGFKGVFFFLMLKARM
jgi:hypothetical protein